MTRIALLALLVGCTSDPPLVLTGQITASGPHPDILDVEIVFGSASDHEAIVTVAAFSGTDTASFETPAIHFSDERLVESPGGFKMAHATTWITDPFAGPIPQRLQSAGYRIVYVTEESDTTPFAIELQAGWNLLREIEGGYELASIDAPLAITLE